MDFISDLNNKEDARSLSNGGVQKVANLCVPKPAFDFKFLDFSKYLIRRFFR